MIRLDRIKIKGFKDQDTKKQLVFSSEPISVIYGQNGSGKTTMLKILYAILSKNDKMLLHENVMEIVIDYQKDEEHKSLQIIRDENNNINWGDNLDLVNSNSILFGVHRGVNQEKAAPNQIDKRRLLMLMDELNDIFEHPKYRIRPEMEEIRYLMHKILSKSGQIDIKEILFSIERIKEKSDLHRYPELYERINSIRKEIEYYAFSKTYQNEKSSFLKKLESQANISVDFVQINDIQNVIVDQFNKGQNIVSEKIKNAFFETIEKAVEIDETQDVFLLPENFEKRIKENKSFILQAITKENSTLTERIKKYLDTGDSSLTEKSKIFRAMLLKIIESAEKPNPTLEAITKLIQIFNEHLYGNKQLVVDHEKAYISLGNGKFHELTELSSGERNLLSILTLFLIIGNDRNFLMIDEPEISFNLKWQKDFLPLLSRLNSKAQIIVASHSPSIAHKNSKYLVELL